MRDRDRETETERERQREIEREREREAERVTEKSEPESKPLYKKNFVPQTIPSYQGREVTYPN